MRDAVRHEHIPELQRAGRRFPERLIRENGPEASVILRRMADELDEILRDVDAPDADPQACRKPWN